jgi:Fe-S cluster assembly protein SufD
VLDDRGRGVFNGKIFVREDAQKTDAKQTNQVLLLSDDATIDTKPQLEIFADDVKCTHGATVGQLSEESLFYLRARGIGKDDARALLVHAFAESVVENIRIDSVRHALEQVLLARLPIRE